MNYNCFLKEVTQRVREKVHSGCTVQVKQVKKNNGILLDCMSICRPGEVICPNIYLDEVYERYLDGWTLEQAADCILSMWRNSVPAVQIDADELLNSRSRRCTDLSIMRRTDHCWKISPTGRCSILR